MKNLTINQVEKLVQNGMLMSHNNGYGYQIMYANTFKNTDDIPYGYPTLVYSYHYKNEDISPDLFIKVNSNTRQQYYIIPRGLLELKNIDIEDAKVLSSLKDWNNSAKQYLEYKVNEKEEKIDENLLKIENDCLTIYRDIYEGYIKKELIGKSLLDKELLESYIHGIHYRKNIKKHSENLYNSFLSKEEVTTELLSLIENEEDLKNFENAALNLSRGNTLYYISNKYLGIYVELYELWYSIIEKVYEDGLHKDENSLFLKHFVDNLRTTKMSGNDMIEILKQIQAFDTDIVIQEYLHHFNKSDKKAVVKFCESFLEKNDALPKVENSLLLSEEPQIVYTHKLKFNYNFIRQAINNNPMASQTLMMIVHNEFRNIEKECFDLETKFLMDDGVVELIVSSLNKDNINVLKEKLKQYVEAVISEQFLTKEMLKKLCKNSTTRIPYENKVDVINSYKKVKDNFILKNKLEENLQDKAHVYTKTKKI